MSPLSLDMSRLEVKDEAQKQSLEELLLEWKKNRVELYEEIKKSYLTGKSLFA